MRKKKNLQGCPHLIYLLILRFPCKYHCLSSSYLKLISHHPPHFSHFYGQGRLLISLIPCSHLNADRYDEDMVNIFLLFYSLCCWLKSFSVLTLKSQYYSTDILVILFFFFLELRRVMDITDFTITHHLMIVLLLLRLVSVFDNRDPVPYFISLIYLRMVLIVHSLPSFSFFFFYGWLICLHWGTSLHLFDFFY